VTVEIFFKWIKENLKINSFLGSGPAVRGRVCRIRVAIITILPRASYNFRAKLGRALSQVRCVSLKET
jgi:hypothetical protein